MNEEKDWLDFIKLIKEFKAHKSVTYSEEKKKIAPASEKCEPFK